MASQEIPIKAYDQIYPNEEADRGLHTSLAQDGMDVSHATTTTGGESANTYDSATDFSAHFRDIDGRRFSSRTSTYMLPADEIEFWRLDKQNTCFLVALEGLYPCPDLVERVLAPRTGEVIEIIDLGCGTGAWALSMAKRFTHAQVLGIDIAPVPLKPEMLTSNIRFEMDDVNSGLPHYAGRFDLVHMRCVGGGLPVYTEAMTTAARCLKPGGVLVIIELDTLLCAEDMVSSQKMSSPNQLDGSWIQRFFHEFRWAYTVDGSNLHQSERTIYNGLWDHPLLDGCGGAGLHIPLGPWPKVDEPEEAQRLEFSGILMRQNIRNALISCQTVMRRNNVPQTFLDQLVQECESELDSLNQHNWFYGLMIWGQRNNVDTPVGSETISQTLDLHPSTWSPHRQVHIYRTAEECHKARKMRLDTIGELVEPQAARSI